MKNSCADCEAFRPDGACHRYPPGLLQGQIRVWPTVDPRDWCGEFQRKTSLLLLERASRPKWWEFWK